MFPVAEGRTFGRSHAFDVVVLAAGKLVDERDVLARCLKATLAKWPEEQRPTIDADVESLL